jgi:hypothetical protein
MIPANVDHIGIIADLNTWGIRDYKIELCCNFSEGYVAQLKCGNVKQMAYQRAARLYNFWFEERVSRATLQTQGLVATT